MAECIDKYIWITEWINTKLFCFGLVLVILLLLLF